MKGYKHTEATKNILREHNLLHPRRYWLGKKRSQATIEKIRQSRKGISAWNKGKKTGQIVWNKGTKGICKSNSGSFKKGMTTWNKGGEGLKGEKNPMFGKHPSKEVLEKMSISKLNLFKDKTKHPRWQGGITPFYKQIRSEILKKGNVYSLEQWEELKKKYNFMCLCCKRFEPEIKLTADHIIPVMVWNDWIKNNSKIDYSCGSIKNIQPLCGNCNSKKQKKVIDFRVNNFILI